MKYYTFERESNKFDDVLKDPTLRKLIYHMTTWKNHLCIGINDDECKLKSYIVLKYGDELRTNLTKDYRPIPGVDYTPKRKE